MSSTASGVQPDPFGVRANITTADGETYGYYRLQGLEEQGVANLASLPFTIRILVENLLRHAGTEFVSNDVIERLAKWSPTAAADDFELPFMPGRVVLQDFTGVPAVVDLAAMRSAVGRMGGDVTRINPLVPADLVIDHSVQVDYFGTNLAFGNNVQLEYQRNSERYTLLRWAQQSFQNFRVVPPGTGIVHQVNLEFLASVVATRQSAAHDVVAFPDTLVGTDSHTTMINGLGVLGWGVGGIEAEAVLLGQPLYQLMPEVIGFRLSGSLDPGATATDLVLHVTQILRKHGVVGKFVEFFGTGLSTLPLADRATISNMAPEYGATAALFPVDNETLRYLTTTGRPTALVEAYCKEQGLFRTDGTPDPTYNDVLQLDLSTVVPSLAGPRRPQDRVALNDVQTVFRSSYPEQLGAAAQPTNGHTHLGSVPVTIGNDVSELHHGAVAIAAITSCTNTSNPAVMVGAGLVAQKAVERGLDVPPYVKTSMAPGSQVVSAMLDNAGLTPYLEALGFHTVGYGCTTCIGNSGPLPQPVATSIDDNNLIVAAVLSGNRNFEGRIHSQVRASFLASPPLVVAFALAGTVDIDLASEPIANDPNGQPVYLADIWPTPEEIQSTIASSLSAETFAEEYAGVFTGDEQWQSLDVPQGDLYEWDKESTYVQEPPYFLGDQSVLPDVSDIHGARVLALLGDSVTTDHISPAGSISRTSPAGEYLLNNDVPPIEFNSYGSRRGNHEVMMRGTFANIRLRNHLTPGKEGNWTRFLPTNEEMPIYDAAMFYQEQNIPLVVIGGKEYGTGSSRDWAAKGSLLLGVKAVIVESFERIHRSNLVGMGVLPLQFVNDQNAQTLGLTGEETYAITGIETDLAPNKLLDVTATAADGTVTTFQVRCRIDSAVELTYYRNGGILQTVLRRLTASPEA
ncbi:MAG: aconitate hydratase AcnA [Thermomicrobiales bacterium]|nr:aconitate hydratase AcnA [Thermomicrobiales bacterium]